MAHPLLGWSLTAIAALQLVVLIASPERKPMARFLDLVFTAIFATSAFFLISGS